MTQDATHAARDLLASLDPDTLNPEQFNAWHALDAALRDGEATEGAKPAAFVDKKGALLIPDGSLLVAALKALPDAAFGEEVLPLFLSATPPVAQTGTVGSETLREAQIEAMTETAIDGPGYVSFYPSFHDCRRLLEAALPAPTVEDKP